MHPAWDLILSLVARQLPPADGASLPTRRAEVTSMYPAIGCHPITSTRTQRLIGPESAAHQDEETPLLKPMPTAEPEAKPSPQIKSDRPR